MLRRLLRGTAPGRRASSTHGCAQQGLPGTEEGADGRAGPPGRRARRGKARGGAKASSAHRAGRPGAPAIEQKKKQNKKRTGGAGGRAAGPPCRQSSAPAAARGRHPCWNFGGEAAGGRAVRGGEERGGGGGRGGSGRGWARSRLGAWPLPLRPDCPATPRPCFEGTLGVGAGARLAVPGARARRRARPGRQPPSAEQVGGGSGTLPPAGAARTAASSPWTAGHAHRPALCIRNWRAGRAAPAPWPGGARPEGRRRGPPIRAAAALPSGGRRARHGRPIPSRSAKNAPVGELPEGALPFGGIGAGVSHGCGWCFGGGFFFPCGGGGEKKRE